MYQKEAKKTDLKNSVANRVVKQQKSSGITLEDNRASTVIQQKQIDTIQSTIPIQKKKNNTGLPDRLKSGMENLSGHSMDDVKVHYNSSKPAQLNAHAYAQGTNIHLASGQEKHLPHEAWHVIQQKQGRVQPTIQTKGVAINDDKGLEKEADVMGNKATQLQTSSSLKPLKQSFISSPTTQGYFIITSLGMDPIKKVPSDYYQGQIGARKLNRAISNWGRDSIPHRYVTWDAAVADIVNLDKRKVVMTNFLKTFKAKFDVVLDNYHSKRSRIHPSLLDQINRSLLFLRKKSREWEYETGWMDHFKQDLQHSWELIKKAEKLQELGPVEEEEHKMEAEPRKGDEQLRVMSHRQVPHLHGVPGKLSNPDVRIRHEAIGVIRGTDNEEHVQTSGDVVDKTGPYIKGAIMAPFIRDNRKALLNLVRMVGNATAIFSLERGGSLIADHLTALGQKIMNVKIAKTEDRTSQHRNLALAMMKLEEGIMFKMLSKNPLLLANPPIITIALTETAISGSSVNTLLKTLSQYHHLLPQSKFRILVERQTIKEARLSPRRTGGIRVEDPGIDLEKNLVTSAIPKVEMFISHTQYILGEDVDYQISYHNRHAGQPLVVFDSAKDQIVAVSLSSPSMTPRQLIMKLVAGAYDRTLAKAFERF